MKLINANQNEWVNRHETFTEKIQGLYIAANEPDLNALDGYNDTTKALQKIIGDRIETNTPLRVLGSGWSFTKVATATNAYMLDTKQLNTTLNISESSVSENYKGDPKKMLFAQCGCGVWELSKELRSKHLSLKTSGASNGQTIVGAMATGAHGSSIDVGAIQDYVVGMHIIVSPTRHIWLEKKSYPVVSDSFVQKLNTELVQDDDLFNSALVSFGSFGIIHGVIVEAEDLFLLETYMQRMPYDDKLKEVMNTLNFDGLELPYEGERPFHFAININPYDRENKAYVSAFYKRLYRDDYVRPVVNAEGIGPGDDAPCFMGRITDAVPALVPTLVNKLIAGVFVPFEKQFGTLAEIFNNTTLHGKLLSAAMGVPIDQVTRVTDILFDINESSGPFPGLFAYRFIKKSDAQLAFTRYKYTCILELDGVFSDATREFYEAVWSRLDEENIPYTFHWGKINELYPERIERMYGEDANVWISARNKLLDADGRKVFSNQLLQQWGLDKSL